MELLDGPSGACKKNPFEARVVEDEVDLDALAESALEKYRTFFRENDDWPGIVYPVEIRYLSLLHRVVKLVAAGDTTLFGIAISKSGRASIVPEALGLALADIFSADFVAIRSEFPMHKFTPYFELIANTRFRIEREWLRRDLSVLKAQRMAKSLNKRVLALRRRLRDPELARRYSNFRRTPTENFNGLMDCMECLVTEFDSHLIARFDCHYQIAESQLSAEDLEADLDALKAVQKCRDRFHRSLDRRLGSSLRGFAFCLEYGRDRRWHYHYVMFIDPSYSDDDVDLVNDFKKIWAEITKGSRGELSHLLQTTAVGGRPRDGSSDAVACDRAWVGGT